MVGHILPFQALAFPRMKGSMREKRPGYWQLRVLEGRDPITGALKYRTKSMRCSKRDAQRALAALVTEVDKGRVAPTGDTVGQLLDAWLEHIETLGRSPRTLQGYRELQGRLPDGFLATPLRKVTPKLLDDLYRHLGKKKGRSASTVLQYHRMLRASFNQALRWELLDRNPVKLASPPTPHRIEIEPPAIEDVKTVLEAATLSRNPGNALPFRLLAATGCRRGEVCALQWSDIDLDTGEVKFRRSVVHVNGELIVKDTKTHQQRRVIIDDRTLDLLQARLTEVRDIARWAKVKLPKDGFVLSDDPRGKTALPPDRLSQAWARLCAAEGVTARLHDLRHLQASMLLDAGEAVSTVAARLGHRDTSTTLNVYSHLMPGADSRAAEIVGGHLD